MIAERPAIAESGEKQRKALAMKAAAIGSAALACLGVAGLKSAEARTSANIKPGMQFVGVDIDVRTPDTEEVDRQLDTIEELGFNSVRFMTTWIRSQAEAYNDVPMLQHAVEGARERGIEPMLSVTPCWDHSNKECVAPTSSGRNRFTTTLAHLGRVLDVKYWMIGNEPNNPIFWDFQYSKEGESRAPAAYYKLVSRSYDELKKLSPENVVICGSLAAGGNDNPDGKRPSHSPYTFIKLMAEAYKKSGRTTPFCDILSVHPYPASPTEAPDTQHGLNELGIGDYDKLVKTWYDAFKGTAQPMVPIYYGEYGYESNITSGKRQLYSSKQGDRLNETTRGQYMSKAYQMAACQARVIGMNNFSLYDEQDLSRLQMGLYYADQKTAKTSLPAITRAAQDAKTGAVTC